MGSRRLVIILLVASGISLALGDAVGGPIIIAMVLLSGLLNSGMEFQAHHAVEEIRKQVATTAAAWFAAELLIGCLAG
jgi:P-type Mg2+ transporter